MTARSLRSTDSRSGDEREHLLAVSTKKASASRDCGSRNGNAASREWCAAVTKSKRAARVPSRNRIVSSRSIQADWTIRLTSILPELRSCTSETPHLSRCSTAERIRAPRLRNCHQVFSIAAHERDAYLDIETRPETCRDAPEIRH